MDTKSFANVKQSHVLPVPSASCFPNMIRWLTKSKASRWGLARTLVSHLQHRSLLLWCARASLNSIELTRTPENHRFPGRRVCNVRPHTQYVATGYVYDRHTNSFLLIFHKKSGKWLSPGGHLHE